MASFYRHTNSSATSTQSTGSRRLSAHNPFRQPSQVLANYRASSASNSTPTISEFSELVTDRRTMSPEAFESWILKNQELESLSDDVKSFDEDDLVRNDVFIKPSRPQVPQRAGSDSSVVIRHNTTISAQNSGNSNMSNYANNPFADALTSTSTATSETPSFKAVQPVPRRTTSSSPVYHQQQQPRSYRSVPPPVNRASKDMPPPSYEEAAGREAALSPYRDEKEPSRRSNGEHRSSHRHRSHSDSEHRSSSGRHHSSREYHSTSRSGEKSRHHHSSRSGKSKSEKKAKEAPKPKNLDTIDKLDVTGLFGGGFHHDGPFEACTPHRNKDKKAAPVMAFPLDGPNSSIKGASQPIKEQLIDYAFGVPNEDDLYQTSKKGSLNVVTKEIPPALGNRQVYANGSSSQSNATIRAIKNDASVVQFDSSSKAEPVHGPTSLGLGSSTFIDGAPAPRAALIDEANHNTLGRKKSLVHRVRSMRRKN